jgi:hypothetical protein
MHVIDYLLFSQENLRFKLGFLLSLLGPHPLLFACGAGDRTLYLTQTPAVTEAMPAPQVLLSSSYGYPRKPVRR